jgi:hypothetical protein
MEIFQVEGSDLILLYLLLALSLVPALSLIGHIFTNDGREYIKVNPFMGLYFIVFFVFAYFFWFHPRVFIDYLGLEFKIRALLYGALSLVPFFESELPN